MAPAVASARPAYELVLLDDHDCGLTATAALADDGDEDPGDAEDDGENGVGDLERLGRVRDVQPQAAVDDA